MEKDGEERRPVEQGLLSIAPQLLPSLRGSIVNFISSMLIIVWG